MDNQQQPTDQQMAATTLQLLQRANLQFSELDAGNAVRAWLVQIANSGPQVASEEE